MLPWLHSLCMTQFCHPHSSFIHMCAQINTSKVKEVAHKDLASPLASTDVQLCSWNCLVPQNSSESCNIHKPLINKKDGVDRKANETILLWNIGAIPARVTSTGQKLLSKQEKKCPLTFATVLPTDKSWGLSWVGTFLLLFLICLCASWRARTESSRWQPCPERQYLSRNPEENSLWVFIRHYQHPQSHRGSKNRKTLLATITHDYSPLRS